MTRSARIASAWLWMIACAAPAAGLADDLYPRDGWSALASDRVADRVGDSLTVVIYENATASNSTQSGALRTRTLGGQVSGGTSFNESGQLGLTGRSDSTNQTGRIGKMMAQISVGVDAVLPNGDLRVSGEQVLNINGEHTRIRLRGRVRRADISGGNTVLSTRLAEAAIDYDGSGFAAPGQRRGIASRVFRFLGLS